MVKGCYGIWVIVCVYCVVFPVLYGECVEFGTIKCGLRSMGCFGSGVLGHSRGEYVVWSVGVERVVLWVCSIKERVKKNDEEVVRVAGYRGHFQEIINI